MLDWEIKCSKRIIPEQVTPKIKWWRLKEENLKIQFREKVLSERILLENVQEWWAENSTLTVRAGQEVLGMTTGRRPPGDKETWWWNDEAKDAIRAKKEAKKKWDASGRQEERDIYRQANKEAKKEVARSKAHAMDEVYKELETPVGERKIYRIAKARDKSAKDFTQIRQIKDEQGVVLWEHDKIIERWKEYRTVYRTVVRPALMCGAETWALKKAQEKKLEVAEMRMLRWMCGVTKLDKVRNERIRGTTKVGELTKKVQERRLKWYGHVMRREEHYVGRRAMVMKVQGRRKRGRPKRRWLDKVKDDIKEKGLSADDVYDRATWRRMSSYIDPT